MLKIIKRAVLSLFCSVIFLVIYLFLGVIVFAHQSDTMQELTGFPVSFGYYLYKYFGGLDTPDYVEKNRIVFFATIFALPILLYSFLFYLLITIVALLRSPKRELTAPPLPPERFD